MNMFSEGGKTMNRHNKHLKDPGSAITHFIGMLMAIFAAVPLLIKAAREPDHIYLISLTIYALSLILLYAASTTYHTFDLSEKANTILKKIDHMMIFILIAGSYTPICLITLKGRTGVILLSLVWGIALVGIILKAFWVFCPKWVSSILYIGMGWTCVLAFTQILKCSDGTFYTGWTNDLKKRLKAHNEGKGAKYTKTRRPVALQYYEVFASREEAMRREYQIKRLPRKRKEELIENYQEYQKESQTGHEIGYQKENPA